MVAQVGQIVGNPLNQEKLLFFRFTFIKLLVKVRLIFKWWTMSLAQIILGLNECKQFENIVSYKKYDETGTYLWSLTMGHKLFSLSKCRIGHTLFICGEYIYIDHRDNAGTIPTQII